MAVAETFGNPHEGKPFDEDGSKHLVTALGRIDRFAKEACAGRVIHDGCSWENCHMVFPVNGPKSYPYPQTVQARFATIDAMKTPKSKPKRRSAPFVPSDAQPTKFAPRRSRARKPCDNPAPKIAIFPVFFANHAPKMSSRFPPWKSAFIMRRHRDGIGSPRSKVLQGLAHRER